MKVMDRLASNFTSGIVVKVSTKVTEIIIFGVIIDVSDRKDQMFERNIL